MAKINKVLVGESLVGDGNEVAHIDLIMGPRGSAADDQLQELLGEDSLSNMDAFDRVQLAHVIDVCRKCRSLSEAGRALFNASRGRRATTNDADRLRKYLSRFGIEWSDFQMRRG